MRSLERVRLGIKSSNGPEGKFQLHQATYVVLLKGVITTCLSDAMTNIVVMAFETLGEGGGMFLYDTESNINILVAANSNSLYDYSYYRKIHQNIFRFKIPNMDGTTLLARKPYITPTVSTEP